MHEKWTVFKWFLYLYKAFYAPNFSFDFLSFFLNVILKTIFKNLIFNVFELERNNMFVSR